MKKIQTILIVAFLSTIIFGQKAISNNNSIIEMSMQELQESEKLVINYDLVKSILDFKADEEYISFTDIYRDLQGRERVDFVREYLVTDLDQESLINIKDRVIVTNELLAEQIKSEGYGISKQLNINTQNDLGYIEKK